MLTIGHSNRTLEVFLEILRAHGVKLLVDVRTVPRSRHNPQFNRENLPDSLSAEGIDYRHMPGLGGLRHARKDSTNAGWKNLNFRGYADFMQTPDFEKQIEELEKLDESARVAIMCAEAVPWRCHRSLIADALLARGREVSHIMSATKADRHKLTSFARVNGSKVSYPPPEMGLFEG